MYEADMIFQRVEDSGARKYYLSNREMQIIKNEALIVETFSVIMYIAPALEVKSIAMSGRFFYFTTPRTNLKFSISK